MAEAYIRVSVSEEDRSDVIVMIDGSVVDNWAEEPLELAPGTHNILVKKPGRRNFSKQITLKEDDRIQIPVQLIPNALEVRLDVSPDTEVWLNGEQISTGPWSGLMKAGLNYIMLTKPYYNKKYYSLMIEAGEVPMSLHLEDPTPIQYTYQLASTPSGADVYIDETYRGVTPMTLSDLTPGQHKLVLRKKNYKTQTITLNVGSPDESQQINIRLER